MKRLKKSIQKSARDYFPTITYLLKAHPGPFVFVFALCPLIQKFYVKLCEQIINDRSLDLLNNFYYNLTYENYLIKCSFLKSEIEKDFSLNLILPFTVFKWVCFGYIGAVVLNSIGKYMKGNISKKNGKFGFRFEGMDQRLFFYFLLAAVACFLIFALEVEKALNLAMSIYPNAKQAYDSIKDFATNVLGIDIFSIVFSLCIIFFKLKAYLPLFFHKLHTTKEGLSSANKAKFISIYCKWELLFLFFLFMALGFLVYKLPKAEYYGDLLFYFGIFPFLCLMFSHLTKEIWDDKILSAILRPSESELLKNQNIRKTTDE